MAIYDVYIEKKRFERGFRVDSKIHGSLGEATSRAVVENYLKKNYVDHSDMKILKHVNTKGSDFTYLAKDKQNNYHIILGDNKDYSESTWKNKPPKDFISDVKNTREKWAKEIIFRSYEVKPDLIIQESSKLSPSDRDIINGIKDQKLKTKTEVDMIYQNMLKEGRIKTIVSTTNSHISDIEVLHQLEKENIEYFRIYDVKNQNINLENFTKNGDSGKEFYIKKIPIEEIKKETSVKEKFLR